MKDEMHFLTSKRRRGSIDFAFKVFSSLFFFTNKRKRRRNEYQENTEGFLSLNLLIPHVNVNTLSRKSDKTDGCIFLPKQRHHSSLCL